MPITLESRKQTTTSPIWEMIFSMQQQINLPSQQEARNKTVGAIGVLGPARMDYAKVLATLEGISGNVESLLSPDQKQLRDGDKPTPKE